MKPTIEDGTEEVRVPKRGSASGEEGRRESKNVPSRATNTRVRATATRRTPRHVRNDAGKAAGQHRPTRRRARRARPRPRTARAGRATSTATRSQAPPKRGLDAQYEGMLCTGKVQFFAALIIPIVVMVVIIAAITATA